MAKGALPAFKQFRESDGLHYFKLVDAGGKLLGQSAGYASPREAGEAISKLRRFANAELAKSLAMAQGASEAELQAALAALRSS